MIEFSEIEGVPEAPAFEKIKEFYASIFETVDLEKFARRIDAAEDLLTNLAVSQDRIVGFKIGYRIAPKIFYSWIGGVSMDFRKRGIGEELMRRQHEWCVRNGFEKVRTKTRNRFKPMLMLNIRNDFDIVDVYKDKQNELKIVLEKNLL
jgi:predicted GNAT superfamily acetyltransferase